MEVEERLIAECINGNRKSQHELYLKCHSILLSTCQRYTKEKNEAVSMMNLGYLKILKNLCKYKLEIPFEAWIRKIMINLLIDNYRANKKRLEHISLNDEMTPLHNSGSFDLDEAGHLLDAEEVELMIRHLPVVSRIVFNMFAIDGYSHSEIATIMNIKSGTSKWHVNNARQILQEMIVTKYPELNRYLKKRKA